MLIYALIDPRSGEIRYIGKTVRTAHRRLRRHLARCYLDEGDTHKNRWLRQLLALGIEPRIEILERCSTEDELTVAECRHIAEHRALGCRLTNSTDGGEGMTGWKHTAESIAKLRHALTGKPKSAAHRAKIIAIITGRRASDATRAKLSALRKGKNYTPRTEAYRLTMRDAKGGRPFVDQYGNRYETQKGTARQLGLQSGHINSVLKGTRRSTGGYVFCYISRPGVSELKGTE